VVEWFLVLEWKFRIWILSHLGGEANTLKHVLFEYRMNMFWIVEGWGSGGRNDNVDYPWIMSIVASLISFLQVMCWVTIVSWMCDFSTHGRGILTQIGPIPLDSDSVVCCVWQALTVLEYLVANGAERVIDELLEHTYQIQVHIYAQLFCELQITTFSSATWLL